MSPHLLGNNATNLQQKHYIYNTVRFGARLIYSLNLWQAFTRGKSL